MTPAEREYLVLFNDGEARSPGEIAYWLGFDKPFSAAGVGKVLSRICRHGLLECMPGNTYRLTEAGKAALANPPSPSPEG